ncbi:hypothetical protein POTOM_025222 [Populus tomentosa]|uniref:Uncharacterized protein n=1 Tax=Populus tomentosa TaxID=118781 RepID=A0A8X7ZGS7_POPTO|nr:hypothetical protein POTOM_025222 [Populus tomentosa]
MQSREENTYLVLVLPEAKMKIGQCYSSLFLHLVFLSLCVYSLVLLRIRLFEGEGGGATGDKASTVYCVIRLPLVLCFQCSFLVKSMGVLLLSGFLEAEELLKMVKRWLKLIPYIERQPLGTAAQNQDVEDCTEPPPAPLLEPGELSSGWGRKNLAPSVPGLEFRALLVYCTAGISGTALLTKLVI